MNRIILLLAAFCCFVFSNASYSQDTYSKNSPQKIERTLTKHDELINLLNEIDGTFQIRVKQGAPKPIISIPLLEKIKSSRLYNQPFYLDVESGISVFIPSQLEISSPNFVKLEKVINLLNTTENEFK